MAAGTRSACHELVEPRRHRTCELRVVDIRVDLVELDYRPVDELAQSRDERLVRAPRSQRTCPSVVRSEKPRSGTNRTVGPLAAFSLRAITAASSRHSSGCRPGRDHELVVDVDRPVTKPSGSGSGRPGRRDRDHIERPERDDLRDAETPGRLEPLRTGRPNSARELVGELGRGRHRARRRRGRRRSALPSTCRRCRSDGRRARRSRAPRAALEPRSRTGS